jgi:glycosyltransferase involved in cell wall biosynthesis
MCGLRAIVVSPLLPEPPVTGGQKRTLRLLEAMERSGLTPHILTADLGATETLRDRGWVVEVLPEPPPDLVDRARQHLARLPSPYLRGVGARFAELAPHAALVQFEHTQSAYYAVPKGVPSVLSLHNVDSAMAQPFIRRRALRAVERRAYPRMDRVLCVSEADAASVRARGGHAVLAPNGVDDAFFDVTGEGEGALFFGAMDYEPNRRGLERFLAEGWPVVQRALPGARLHVAGPGSERIQGGLGVVEDLPALLATARAVVVPIWEGGGTRLKVLEALAAGRAVVSTPLGAEGIGFEHGRHGLLASTPEELGAALATVLAAPGSFGAEGRKLARRFRWPDALAAASAFYAEAAHGLAGIGR